MSSSDEMPLRLKAKLRQKTASVRSSAPSFPRDDSTSDEEPVSSRRRKANRAYSTRTTSRYSTSSTSRHATRQPHPSTGSAPYEHASTFLPPSGLVKLKLPQPKMDINQMLNNYGCNSIAHALQKLLHWRDNPVESRKSYDSDIATLSARISAMQTQIDDQAIQLEAERKRNTSIEANLAEQDLTRQGEHASLSERIASLEITVKKLKIILGNNGAIKSERPTTPTTRHPTGSIPLDNVHPRMNSSSNQDNFASVKRQKTFDSHGTESNQIPQGSFNEDHNVTAAGRQTKNTLVTPDYAATDNAARTDGAERQQHQQGVTAQHEPRPLGHDAMYRGMFHPSTAVTVMRGGRGGRGGRGRVIQRPAAQRPLPPPTAPLTAPAQQPDLSKKRS